MKAYEVHVNIKLYPFGPHCGSTGHICTVLHSIVRVELGNYSTVSEEVGTHHVSYHVWLILDGGNVHISHPVGGLFFSIGVYYFQE